ncbi:hypothetical protein Sa4125_40680 [Aureimonas sp. SA4125]|nr:hypothetical protein Sa4125_40680 [Aureimonas sp. SA4125]
MALLHLAKDEADLRVEGVVVALARRAGFDVQSILHAAVYAQRQGARQGATRHAAAASRQMLLI